MLFSTFSAKAARKPPLVGSWGSAPLGGVLGRSWRLLGQSWGAFGHHHRAVGAFSEGAVAKMRKPWFFFYDSTALFEVFSGSRGSKNRSRRFKIAPKRALEAPNSSRMSSGGSKWLENELRRIKMVQNSAPDEPMG